MMEEVFFSTLLAVNEFFTDSPLSRSFVYDECSLCRIGVKIDGGSMNHQKPVVMKPQMPYKKRKHHLEYGQ